MFAIYHLLREIGAFLFCACVVEGVMIFPVSLEFFGSLCLRRAARKGDEDDQSFHFRFRSSSIVLTISAMMQSAITTAGRP